MYLKKKWSVVLLLTLLVSKKGISLHIYFEAFVWIIFVRLHVYGSLKL